MQTKVISYIDGFNLYYALKKKGWQRYYWLNLQELSQRLLKPNQTLVGTKYFTARVKSNPGKKKRQGVFLDAQKTLPDLELIEGSYQKRKRLCTQCNQFYWTYEEKMTDVNIAVELLDDAFNDRFDTALLISADSDLTKPIQTVKRIFPQKRIVAVFPPGYSSFSLKKHTDAHLTIGRKTLKDSLFPAAVTAAKGRILHKPRDWS
jgi:uncharacterized LabA/DUF88 family protein